MEPPFFGWRAGSARPFDVRQDISPDTIKEKQRAEYRRISHYRSHRQDRHGQTNVDAGLRPASLLRFVIDGLPVPSRRVPWSEILAFKSDPDSDERLRALRAWVTTTARGGVTLAEASDQLSFALSSYREHVRSAGIAHDMATWEVLLRSEIVSPNESIVKWTQGQSARPFDLAVAAAGAHAERYAPGREVS